MKPDGNPMQSAHDSPRCAATSKRSGKPCRAPAVRGWSVCRMHGAGGGAPSGKGNGNWRHGGRSNQMAEIRAFAATLRREGQALVSEMDRNAD